MGRIVCSNYFTTVSKINSKPLQKEAEFTVYLFNNIFGAADIRFHSEDLNTYQPFQVSLKYDKRIPKIMGYRMTFWRKYKNGKALLESVFVVSPYYETLPAKPNEAFRYITLDSRKYKCIVNNEIEKIKFVQEMGMIHKEWRTLLSV